MLPSVGERLTLSKFELVKVAFQNTTPVGTLSITVKSTPDRFVFGKYVFCRITLEMLTPDKFASRNEVLSKFAPARLLFLVSVKSTALKSASLRFTFSRFVFLKLASHKDDLDRFFPDKSSPSNTVL